MKDTPLAVQCSTCFSSEGEQKGNATLTSLLTPVKIDGDPSGQTCEQGEEERMEEGREDGEGGGGEQKRNKASDKLARTPVHANPNIHTHLTEL